MQGSRHRCSSTFRALLLLCSLTSLLAVLPPSQTIHAKSAPRAMHGPVAQTTSIARQPLRSPLPPQPNITPQSIAAHASQDAVASSSSRTATLFGQLPLAFEENIGQTDKTVQYLARSRAGTVFFTPDEIVVGVPNDAPTTQPRQGDTKRLTSPSPITATQPISISVVRWSYLQAKQSPKIVADMPLPGVVNYVRGKERSSWQTNVRTYSGMTYQQLYDGIDLRYEGTEGDLKSTYSVAPGADPNQIQWRYQGIKDIKVDALGNLVITVPPGLAKGANATTVYTLTEQAPIAWQDIKDQRVAVDVRYVIADDRSVRFTIGAYDRSQPLIIDPILNYGFIFGGFQADTGRGIAVDSDGSVYVAGSTQSSTFPGASNAYSGNLDAYIAKINVAGTAVLWSAYLGGSDTDSGVDIALDSSNNAYITGWTASNDFPTTSGVIKSALVDLADSFVAKLTSAGSLVYSTYLGEDTRFDEARAIVVHRNSDSSISTYIVGTVGTINDSPTVEDAFVTKINGSGTAISYNQTFEGSADDVGNSIAIDPLGNAYITGVTYSNSSLSVPFPTTGGAFQPSSTDTDGDAFVVKLNTSGSVVYSSFLGGAQSDGGWGITVDSSGRATILGDTTSSDFPIPATAASYDRSCGTDGNCNGPFTSDFFVTTFNAAGSALRYSTFLGGSASDNGWGSIASDYAGDVYVSGDAGSGFPLVHPIKGSHGTGIIVAKLSPSRNGRSSLIYSTPVLPSGSGSGSGSDLVTSNAGQLFVVGSTAGDAFIAKIVEPTLSDGQTRGPEECQCQNPPPHWTTQHPVNTHTGNFSTQITDLAVQTPGAPLVWTRSYASQATAVATAALGYGWQHPYAGRLIVATDAVTVVSGVGNELRFTLTLSGTYQAAPGIYSTLISDTTTFTQTLRNQAQYVFERTTGQLTTIIDPQEHTLLLSYSGSPAQLDRIEDAADSSRYLELGYTGDQITSVTDGTRTVTYSYDGNGDLETASDVMGRPTTYTYQDHLLTSITNAANQLVEAMTYDVTTPEGKVIAQTLQNGQDIAFSYLPATTIMTTTGVDGRREVQQFKYGANNALIGIDTSTRNESSGDQPPAQSVLGSAFDESFSPGVVVDGNNQTTETSYSNNGLPQERVDALGQTTHVLYNSQNRPISTTNALGITTLMAYDAYNHVISTTTGITTTSLLRATSLYTYTAPTARHPAGLLEAQSGPDGVVTHYSYDSGDLGLVVETTIGYGTPQAQTTAYEYDVLGRRTSTTTGYGTALARTDVTEYNADNTIARTIQNYDDGVFDAGATDQDLITTYGYDLLGRTVAVTDSIGVVSATHYNVAGQVDWTARHLSPFVLDGDGQPAFQGYTTSAPDANVATLYGYDGLGRTVLVTETGILTGSFDLDTYTFSDTSERVTRTEYDELSRPMTVTLNYQPSQPADELYDVNVRTLTYYDGAGNVIWQRDALGRWTKTDYDALNRPITVTLNYENGDPLTIDPLNAGSASLNDTDLLQVTRYDALGRVVQQIDNAVDGVFTISEPITDRITLSDYDTLGRVVTTTVGYDPATLGMRSDTNRTSVNAYDPLTNRLQATQDALGRWSSQQYDLLGRVTQTIQNCRDAGNTPIATGCEPFDPDLPDRNVRSELRYDALGRTFETVDALGHITRSLYDGAGRSVSSVRNYDDGIYDPDAPDTDVTTSQSYDALGRVIAMTDAVGAIATQSYNALGQTVVMTDSMDRVTTFGYDGSGTQRWQRRADGQTTVTFVDGLGRSTTTIVSYVDGIANPLDPNQDLITQTSFDQAGRTIATTSPDGRVTVFAYDLNDRLVGVTENAQTGTCSNDPCNVVTTYTYDRAGNRTTITDARNNTRTFAYDAADQQIAATDALNQTTAWDYDAAGRVTDQDDPRGDDYDLHFSYDEMNRPTQTSAVELDAAISSSYDALGRRTALDDGTGTTSFSYDALGRITQVNAPNTGIVGYGYNGRGNRTRLTYPDSSEVFYSYWNNGQLQDVSLNGTTLASYSYDAVGRLERQTRANGAVTSYSYDSGDRLRDQTTRTHGAITSQFAYAVDLAGQRVGSREFLAASSPTLSLQGHGLQGVYYSDINYTTAVLTRTDALVDFDWGEDAPDPSLPSDGFSVIWTGRIVPTYSEVYTFTTTSDDGVRLTIDNTLLFDDPTSHGPLENSGAITLTAGVSYTIELRYFEDVGGAMVNLDWQSASQVRERVPTSALWPSDMPPTQPVELPQLDQTRVLTYTYDGLQRLTAAETATRDFSATTGLQGVYYSDIAFTTAVLTRSDRLIDFDWGDGAPNVALPSDEFSVRWVGSVVPKYDEVYTFITTSDDGVRLEVANVELFDDTGLHGPEENSNTIALNAGVPVSITLDYFESGGGAMVNLDWLSDSQPREHIPQERLLQPGATSSLPVPVTTQVLTYTYDLAGNRTSLGVDGVVSQTLSYNAANEVVGWTYDEAGNLLSDGTTTYAYDALNRLTAQNSSTRVYNGDGVLVQQDGTFYSQDLAAPLTQILADTTGIYRYGLDRLLAETNGTRTWFVGDALGSVRQLQDNQGTMIGWQSYDPWGVPQSDLATPFGFTGELQDQSGMVYLRARWYAAGSGIFTGRDPFEGNFTVPHSLHWYSYAQNNPILYNDPTGWYHCLESISSDYRDYCADETPIFRQNILTLKPNALGALLQMFANTGEARDFPGGSGQRAQRFRQQDMTSVAERLEFVLWQTAGNQALGADHTNGGKTHFNDIVRQFDDEGFGAQFRDSKIWPDSSHQIGHFLTASHIAYDNSGIPGGDYGSLACLIGHELIGDKDFANPAVDMIYKANQCAQGRGIETILNFLDAVEADVNGNYDRRDCILREIVNLPEIRSQETEYLFTGRDGNSVQDLRLTAKGYIFGTAIRQGSISSISQARKWIETNLRPDNAKAEVEMRRSGGGGGNSEFH